MRCAEITLLGSAIDLPWENTPMTRRQIFALLLSCLALSLPPLRAYAAGEHHLIIVGVDGLNPKGIEDAKTPNIHAMMKSGAWSFHARTVFPTVSSPNWASMIMGAPVEMTGVLSNEWQPKGAAIAPACEDAPGIFPTIFGLEHRQHPTAKVGIFTDWPDFVRLVEPDIVNPIFVTDEQEDPVLEHALAYLKSEKPEFLFIHLDHVDHAGHNHGWGSPEYLAAVEKTDRMLGEIRGLVHSMGIEDTTTILFTADHGGIERRHGGLTMAETEIPWIIAGKRIVQDHQLTAPIMQYDTAATAAYLLGLTPDPCWRGQPVRSAFKKK
jgi:hypothetical protein